MQAPKTTRARPAVDAPKCGVPKCRCRAKEFGVCGRHKQFAYLPVDETIFSEDMASIRTMIETVIEEDKKVNVLGVQQYWNNNMCGGPKKPVPEKYKRTSSALEGMCPEIRRLQAKYNPYLVSNSVTRLNHSYNPRGCHCFICSLGTVPVEAE